MTSKFAMKLLYGMLVAALLAGAAHAQEDSLESIAEQDKARAAELNPSADESAPIPSGPPPADPGPLFVGVDDATVDAFRVNVDTNAFTTAFSGVEVWGSAYDANNDRVLFNAGSTLWEWPVGGAPNMLGTIRDGAGAAQSMTGLAWYDGTLYGCKNISNEAVWEINADTQVASVFIDYDDGAVDCGGLAVDQSTGDIYTTSDDTDTRGLNIINPDGSLTLITPYPDSQTDIDGLAVGGGKAYFVIDQPGSIYVWDLAGAAFDAPLTNPWSTSEIFSGAAWIEQVGAPEPIARFQVSKDFNDNNPAEVEVTISCNTGLPLEQTTSISEGDGVTFVVTDFADGEMDCEISEEVPNGYAVEYFTDAGPSLIDCGFQEVAHGGFYTCAIVNSLLDVDVEVTKVWIDENPEFNAQNVAGAEWSCSNVAEVCDGFDCNSGGFLDFNGNPDTDVFSVFPDWDGNTTCSIIEIDLFESGIEVDDSECQGLTVFPGTGASCTIYNTRLYEGIPTLSQYGLGLLALLMLGMGLVAFRRLA